jgi:hypothetical protein
MAFLEQWFDAALAVDTALTGESFTQEEIERIQTAACRILVAIEIPRRLGGDATNDELALDKRRCRRALHVLRSGLLSWSEKDDDKVKWRPLTDEDKAEGASLLWDKWWEEQQGYLLERRAYIATWGLKKPDTAYAKPAVTRITTELNHMSYAMR